MKFGILITVILALLLVWYLNQQQSVDTTSMATAETTVKSLQKEVEIESSTAQPVKPTPQKNNIELTSLQADKSVLLPPDQDFHPDPMIDAFIGMIEHSICNRFSSPDSDNQIQLSDLSEKQRDHLMPHFDQCKNQAEQVKRYSPDKLMYQLSQMIQNPDDKQRLQDLLFSSKPYTTEQVADIYAEIRQLTGMELLVTTTMYQRFVKQEITPLVKAELQAHDQGMIDYVIKQASFLLACERGADCSANSPVMNNICLEYQQGCGLDLPTFINTHYTVGIRNEIHITHNRLKTLFSFN